MGCCGNNTGRGEKLFSKTRQIATGFSRLARGVKSKYTRERIETCHKCEFNYWVGRNLFCSICACYIPAKARADENSCPKKKWPS